MDYTLSLSMEGKEDAITDIDKDVVARTATGKPIKPKTLGQKNYIDEIRKKMIVFGIGPAGTGKTYLAMAMAIQAFKNNEVNRIILTRPAIEAGEKLGFLPGDLQSKIFIDLTAKAKVEYCKEYKGDGVVLYAMDIKGAKKPEDDLVYFN